ncbi:MAG: hypothetical protein AABZ08_02845 [Planctomycetota bacterium]
MALRRLIHSNQRLARGTGRAHIVALFLGCMVTLTSGCVQMAALWTNMTGGDWIPAQFTLTKEPLLILIDDRGSTVTEPKAIREAHKTIAVNFAEFKVNHNVIPFEEWQRLAQTDKKYNRYSIRQVGEKLGAEQVLYINVERFTLHGEPGAPVFKGEFTVRVKIMSTNREKDIRLWPSEESGKRVSVSSAPVPIDSEKSASDIANELGIKLGKEVSMMFYGHRELEK